MVKIAEAVILAGTLITKAKTGKECISKGTIKDTRVKE